MMLKGRGKEIDLDISNNYNILIGTVDSKNPKSIYYKISGWGQPLDDDETIDYSKVLSKLHKDIKQYIYNEIDCEIFDCNVTIVDFDMRDSGISFDKKSFMCCEITLFQIDSLKINSPEILNISENLLKKLLYNIFEDNEYFKFNKKKK